MALAYLVVCGSYLFAAGALLTFISAINHLDPPEAVAPHEEGERELKLAS